MIIFIMILVVMGVVYLVWKTVDKEIKDLDKRMHEKRIEELHFRINIFGFDEMNYIISSNDDIKENLKKLGLWEEWLKIKKYRKK